MQKAPDPQYGRMPDPEPPLTLDKSGLLPWLPVALLLVAIIVLHALYPTSAYPLYSFLVLINLIFFMLVSPFIIFLIGRSFIARGSPGLLLVTLGVFFWGFAGLATVLTFGIVGRPSVNSILAIHNIGVWLSGLCHVSGAAYSVRSRRTLKSCSAWLAVSLASCVAAAVGLAAASISGNLPAFFVPGSGSTTVRFFVLGSASIMFFLSGIIMRGETRFERTPFIEWYSHALFLIAAGLFGVLVAAFDTPGCWAGRLAQYLGSFYMMIAAIVSLRDRGGQDVTLGKQKEEVIYPYAIALIAAIVATTAALLLLDRVEDFPTSTFYPAVVLAALYGGFRAGIVTTALSALLGYFFWTMPDAGLGIGSFSQLVEITIFFASGAFISVIIESMHRMQSRATEAEALARVAEEREKASRAIKQERDLLQAVMNGTGKSSLVYLDREFNFIMVNESYARSCGYSPGDMIGRNHFDLYPHPENRAIFVRARDTGDSVEYRDRPFEYLHQPKKGITYWDWTLTPVKDEAAAVIGLVFALYETTDRFKAEEELRQNRERLRWVLERTGVGMWFNDLVLRNMHWDMLTRRLFSVGEDVPATPRLFHDRLHPTDRSAVQTGIKSAIREGRVFDMDHRVVDPDTEEVRWIHAVGEAAYAPDGRPLRFDGIVFDITQRKRLEEELRKANESMEKCVEARTRELAEAVLKLKEEMRERKRIEQQLVQSQKMESIGLLAGGIAHDFNNLLSAIFGYAENIIETIPKEDTENLENAAGVLSAARRAAEMTRRLLAFSRKQEINPKPVYVDEVVAGAYKLIQRIIGEDVELVTDFRDREVQVMADASQLEQVIMNLAANSRDAMPNGGRLSISVRRTELQKGVESFYDLPEPGEYAVISTSDTGSGIDPEELPRLFEPFFTTKEAGKGTGLGLSIVYGIIKQHNGSVSINSEKGMGTTVDIYLPIYGGGSPDETPAPEKSAGGGSETILVAEDEELVRDLLRKTLERAGYTVLVAGEGEEAVSLFRSCNAISLLLSDVVMPKKNGREILDEVRIIKPDIRVIFMSGYTADIVDIKGVAEEGCDFIRKPFSKQELLRKVREVLDRH